MAVDVLKSKGVPEHRILFLNLIASPQGTANFAKKFPKLRVVTAFVDEGLDEKKYHSLSAKKSDLLTQIAAISARAWVTSAIDSTRCDDLLESQSKAYKAKRNCYLDSRLLISEYPTCS